MRKLLSFFVLLVLQSCSDDVPVVCDEERILTIGKTLTGMEISRDNRLSLDDVVSVGYGLIGQLSSVKRRDTLFQYKAIEGDLEYPFGNNEADCVLVITSESHNLRIRLKFNQKKDKYDILGWSDSY